MRVGRLPRQDNSQPLASRILMRVSRLPRQDNHQPLASRILMRVSQLPKLHVLRRKQADVTGRSAISVRTQWLEIWRSPADGAREGTVAIEVQDFRSKTGVSKADLQCRLMPTNWTSGWTQSVPMLALGGQVGSEQVSEAKPRPQHGWRWQESQPHHDEGRHDTRTVPTSSTVMKVGTTQG